jgi:uncharacterized membrane protein
MEEFMNPLLLSAAMAGIVAAASTANAHPTPAGKEKCYGIAKAGKNDCGSADGKHTCAAQAKTDNDPNEWKFVATGECEKQGGSTTKPTPAK